MNTVFAVVALAACVSAQLVVPGPVAVRAPSHDSAIIQSHRLGGNFAYSTHEAHAYAVQHPIIGQRTIPIGVSYVPGTPVVKTTTQVHTHQVPQVGLAYSAFPHHQVAGIPYYAGIPNLPQYAGIPNLPQYAGIPNLPHYAGIPNVPYPYVLNPVDTPVVAAAEPVVDTA